MPAMVHVSASCNPCFHGTGAHYINADTTAFMQLIMGDLFKDFPTLKLIIPHGGGAVPFHWGRYRGLALNNKRPPLDEMMKNNVWFDTCVYHQPGIDRLPRSCRSTTSCSPPRWSARCVSTTRRPGIEFDDTKRYVDHAPGLSPDDKRKSSRATRCAPTRG